MTGSPPSSAAQDAQQQQEQQQKEQRQEQEEEQGEKTAAKEEQSTPEKSPLAASPPQVSPPPQISLPQDGEGDIDAATLPRCKATSGRKQLASSSRSAGWLPGVRPAMDEGYMAASLGRYGRAQSHLALNTAGMDPWLLAGERRDLEDSFGARSELSAPVAGRRRGRRGEVPRAYGTLERATSYSSLASFTPPRPTFRSANSARPPPAPPCTTTQLADLGRHHPVTTVTSTARSVRLGTPTRHSPHPASLPVPGSQNRDGKTSDIWGPDEHSTATQSQQMCRHTEGAQFTSAKRKLLFSPNHHRLSPVPDRGGHHQPLQPLLYPSQQHGGTHGFDRRVAVNGRFGPTSMHRRAMHAGVVPGSMMGPRCGERRVKLHIPRGQKLESLV